jgi:ribosomal protein L13
MRTYSPSAKDITREWYVVDAEGQTLGRLATRIATVLRGKHKPTFTPHLDMGDFVIVVNADKIVLTGRQGRAEALPPPLRVPGRAQVRAVRPMLDRQPTEVVEKARQGHAAQEQARPRWARSSRSTPAPTTRTPRSSPSRCPTTSEDSTMADKIFTGRRKSAVARARVTRGSGQFTLNGRRSRTTSHREAARPRRSSPSRSSSRTGQWDVDARIHGGGTTGQAGALRLAIARALAEHDPEWRGPLKGRAAHP